MLSVADPSGKTRLLAAMCDTCVFHPGNRMHLAPGLAGLVADARKSEGFIVCHTTLPGPWQQAAPAVCRGFHDRYSTAALQIAARLWGFIEVVLPSKLVGTP